MPYIFHHQDNFSQPTSFRPELISDITSVIDKKLESLMHHESQVFEWLPYIKQEEPVPTDPAGRQAWMKQHWTNPSQVLRFLPLLQNAKIEYIEALQRCEYGAPVDAETAEKLFPFASIDFTR